MSAAGVRTLRPTLQLLLIELKDLKDWFIYGATLGIAVHSLRVIESSYHQNQKGRCKLDMLERWLNTNLDASWKDVVRALEQTDQLVLAATIKQKYLWSVASKEKGKYVPNVFKDNKLLYLYR